MNNKKAKTLRRAAQATTVGAPNVLYKQINHPINPGNPNPAKRYPFRNRAQRVLAHQCTRAKYQSMK